MSYTTEVLKKYQCDHIRMLEESFSQTLSERDDVRLFFINENQAFTDGRNIVVDPAIFGLYADEEALLRTSKFLGWSQDILGTPWNALGIITRALNIHECLHILYTDFPCHCANDPLCDTKNKRKVMAKISNIIEDSYIEAAGCSVYDNMEFYLRFIRVAQSFLSDSKPKTAVSLKDILAQGGDIVAPKKERTDADRIADYLGCMCVFLLYPWDWNDDCREDIKDYVERTKQLFLDGAAAESPDKRYEYCQKIFEVIKEIIPDDETELNFGGLSKKLIGGKTHSDEGGITGDAQNKGRTQKVKCRLFTELNGKKRKGNIPDGQIVSIKDELSRNQKAVGDIELEQGQYYYVDYNEVGAPIVHKNIEIHENHPKINYDLRKAYKNVYSKYSTNIRSYSNKFEQLLRAHVTVREEGFKFGGGITSARLGDPQKRYWYRKQEGTDIPDLAVMLLIDGSGSMRGQRIRSAMESAIILHEVLKSQGIEHAIVEHRANFNDPEIDVNVLIDFNFKEDDKLKLMQLRPYGNTRDGLALYWAEKYLSRMTQNEHKLIIVLSDGVPEHDFDNYYPPASVKDTANAVRKIRKRGTDIIAISLDNEGEFECYSLLSEIYPNLIACNDLTRLTGQLLGVIAKLL